MKTYTDNTSNEQSGRGLILSTPAHLFQEDKR